LLEHIGLCYFQNLNLCHWPWVSYQHFYISSSVNFMGPQYQGFNSGLSSCAPLFEPCPQILFALVNFQIGSHAFSQEGPWTTIILPVPFRITGIHQYHQLTCWDVSFCKVFFAWACLELWFCCLLRSWNWFFNCVR
jgi:hypothetical protein